MSEHVGAALERAGALFPEGEAVVDGDLRWSYAELRRRTAAFDAALDGLGLAEGDVVGVLALNSAPHLVAWLGVPRSGRVLNDLNVRLAPAEIQRRSKRRFGQIPRGLTSRSTMPKGGAGPERLRAERLRRRPRPGGSRTGY